MSIRAAFLCVGITLAAVASAQAQPPTSLAGRVTTLEANVADLQQAVATLQTSLASLNGSYAKLDGNTNLTTADLVGTYAVQAIDIPLSGFVPGVPPQNAVIATNAFSGTIQVHADGTLSFTSTTCDGSRLTQGSWSLSPIVCSAPAPSGNWTYQNGVVHVTAGQFDAQFTVALGGRLMTSALAPFHPSDPSSDTLILILSRISQP